VNIIKGCNNFCTYCVVPYTRGREKSRTPEEILQETEFLVGKGVREIVLLGQNVNSYGLDNSERDEGYLTHTPFIDLLYKVANVKGLERLRFVTSNPHDFPHKLPQAFADIPILCDQLHLPVQAGSNTVLKSMHRRYTRELYLEKVAALRAVRPEMALSTDIIVGFPGETDADFEQTMSLVQELKYAFIFGFKYSPRPLTPAAKFQNQVPERIKDARLQALLNLQKTITEEQNAAEIGKTRDTLLVYKNKKEASSWYGRTFQGRLVKVLNVEGSSGQTLPVRITDSNATALIAQPC
jgi:tRNA-2-methylthio-N6-dimethylallyladenosine synthase